MDIGEKIFLLTSVSAADGGIGGLFLKSIRDGAEDLEVYWNTETPFLLGEILARFGFLGSLLRSALVRLPFWQSMRLILFDLLIRRRRANKIEKLINSYGAENILVTASSPELIGLGNELVKRGHEVLVMIWDQPEYLARNLRVGHWMTERIMRNFNDFMRGCRAAAVISENMQQNYSRTYGLRCEVIRHGIAPRRRSERTSCRDVIRIIFAGSLYSKVEWNAFVAALESVDWKLENRYVELTFIGKFPVGGAVRPDRVTYHPQVGNSAALEIMASMDIGYIPYWFDSAHADVVSTSFPGKVTAYAAAGLVIFHHAPEYSSVRSFLSRFPFGVVCSSYDPKVICKELLLLFLSIDKDETHQARESAMRECLSESAMIDAFRRLLMIRRSKSERVFSKY